MEKFDLKPVPEEYDDIAPDGSEIRLLTRKSHGNMVHYRLKPGTTSKAITHKTIDELWFFISGYGEIWRKNAETGIDEVQTVKAGISISNPLGTHFQFRNSGKENLDFIIVAMPPWPGDEEAVFVEGYW